MPKSQETTCKECGGRIDPTAYTRWDGPFFEGHDYDCPHYGQPAQRQG